LLVALKERSGPLSGPGVGRYLVNAGTVDQASWYARSETEGSRFCGEGGHFIDTLCWWFEALPAWVHATGGGEADDVQVTIGFDDGSWGSITYTTVGSPRYPKETIEVLAGGKVVRLDNFRRASLWTGRRRRTWHSRIAVDKGQRGELDAFLSAVRSGTRMPVPVSTLAGVTDATLAVVESLTSGETVKLVPR
jgi:predicted dehydrogenase